MSKQTNILPDNPQIEVIKSGRTGLFTNYIYKAIPLAFDESMSYYETLCGLLHYLKNVIIPTVNNNADAVAELQTLYEELRIYVDDYFKGLDVQEEINNKLDKMVEDGTLNNLIGAYIQPRIDAQNLEIQNFENNVNNQINTINNKVDSVANGAPLVASSIQNMTDTSKIYVLTTNGHWYYYDGTNWQDGGTYQSTGIGNNNVTYSNLFEDLENSFESVVDLNTSYANGFHIGQYVNPNGEFKSVASTSCLEINVEEKETYLFNSFYKTSVYTLENPLYIILDENNNVIEKEIINESTNEILTRKISMPKLAKKIIINSVNYTDSTVAQRFGITAFKIKNYNQSNKISYNQLDNNLKNIFKEVYTNFNNSNLRTFKSPGIMGPGMGLKTTTGYTIYSLNVTPGEKYKFHIYNFYNQPSIFCGSKDCVYPITDDNDVTYQVHAQITRYIGETQNTYNDIEFTVPDGCNILYINNENTKNITIKKVTKYNIKLENVDISTDDIEFNPLSNKTILFNGDSIVQSNLNTDPQIVTPIAPNDNRGWVARTQINNPNSICYGYGVSSTTITKRNNQNDSILERCAKMFTEHPNADYIILEGGINDMFLALPIGEITNGYNDKYDENTFCGALESMFRYITLNFKGKKCGFINVFKVPSCTNQKYYVPKIIDICKKWQIPMLDLYNESDLNYYLDSIRQDYSRITELRPDGDGLHPNSNGYNLLQNKIESWIKTL